MDFSRELTIAARASAAGPARQAIVRISGPGCRRIVSRVFAPADADTFWTARVPGRHVGVIRIRQAHAPLPAAAWLWPTNRSYTGEPLCELRMAGAAPLADAVLAELFAAGAHPARSGEFTLRAFLAQRIDLLQAEAVLGVIDATDEDHLKASLTQLAGGLSGAMTALHEQLLLDLADLEAGLDFADEDLEFVDRDSMRDRLAGAASLLLQLQQQAVSRMHEPAVTRVVLAGLPNSGKSTLFNALLDSDSAIVSHQSGTTRDYLIGRVTWEGRDIELVDTPGVEPDPDNVMRSAQALRDQLTHGAQLVIWCRAIDLNGHGRDRDRRARARTVGSGTVTITVSTKSDLADSGDELLPVTVSAVHGCGIEKLQRSVQSALEQAGSRAQELIGSTAARCADSIRLAREAVGRARVLLEDCAGDELVASELRAAVDEIGRITGRIHTEDILDRVFSRFCIGK